MSQADKNNRDYTLKFKELVEIMDRLRGENGCPWDKEQDHTTLLPYLVEEAYEFIETVEEGHQPHKLAEELGDIMLQIVFHARIAKEQKNFDIYDVLESICTKLIRRHPHIFADTQADTAEQVVRNWEEIKLKEKGTTSRKSLLDGIPKGMPSLLYARRLQERAAGVGFDWDEVSGVIDKMYEELDEIKEAIKNKDKEEIKGEIGDLLFNTVNLARWYEINPEEATRHTAAKFIKRFHKIEEEAKKQNRDLSDMSIDEMEEIWQRAKGDHS